MNSTFRVTSVHFVVQYHTIGHHLLAPTHENCTICSLLRISGDMTLDIFQPMDAKHNVDNDFGFEILSLSCVAFMGSDKIKMNS